MFGAQLTRSRTPPVRQSVRNILGDKFACYFGMFGLRILDSNSTLRSCVTLTDQEMNVTSVVQRCRSPVATRTNNHSSGSPKIT